MEGNNFGIYYIPSTCMRTPINEIKSGVARPLKGKLRESSEKLNDAIDHAKEDERSLQDISMGVAKGLARLGGNTAIIWEDNGYDQPPRPMELLRKTRRHLGSKACALLQLTLQLKTEAMKLSRKAADASAYAYNGVEGARRKRNFTAGILDICESAVVDPGLTAEVKMV
ncbi:hypothetical protein FANTH_2967 [Fusarium anthophilum]|uniref:Uncharacterized protein n=1 Tax=Fusarium anthophilum TaxID=48485 RepID=A0A8H4ZSL6_9HYPO|nr:hypothetical protein FANTH_2967 [Fusarium anthophilum]